MLEVKTEYNKYGDQLSVWCMVFIFFIFYIVVINYYDIQRTLFWRPRWSKNYSKYIFIFIFLELSKTARPS